MQEQRQARALASFENLDQYDPEEPPVSAETISERRRALAAVGAQLVGLANSYQPHMRLLARLRQFPRGAGDNLILLSQLKPYGAYNQELRDTVMNQLRLGRPFGDTRI
jgi:hypothetical protein